VCLSVCVCVLTSRTDEEPADSRLAVGWSLSDTQRLTHLSLRQTERQPTDLELLGKLSHLVEVDSIDHDAVVRTTADCIFIHTHSQQFFNRPAFLSVVSPGWAACSKEQLRVASWSRLLRAGYPSSHPTNSVRTLKENELQQQCTPTEMCRVNIYAVSQNKQYT